jgi:hypothetical protein
MLIGNVRSWLDTKAIREQCGQRLGRSPRRRPAYRENLYDYRGIWICTCIVEGLPGYHRHPSAGDDWDESVTFYEVPPEWVPTWCKNNNQPVPEKLAKARPSPPSPNGQPSRQTRLQAILNRKPPFLMLDGQPYPGTEVAVHFVAELIEANGRQVSFSQWVRDHSRFEGSQSDRVLRSLPAEILRFIERGGKGRQPRLKVEALL